MRALSEHDAGAVAAVAAELGALDDAIAFPPQLLGRLAGLLQCDNGTYFEVDPVRRHAELESEWHGGEEWVGATEEGAETASFWRAWDEHPIWRHRERTADWTSTYLRSDFMTLAEWRASTVWEELYAACGCGEYISVAVRSRSDRRCSFAFTRTEHAFDERERLVLDLLQPHLQQRRERVLLAAEAAAALARLEENDGDDPRHVVLCDRNGMIEFASPTTRALLARYLNAAGTRLPETLFDRLRGAENAVVVERDGRRLTLRAAVCGRLVVVLVGEQDTRIDALTARQRAVLALAAQGLTDAEISMSLGIASATVNKHLEGIYRRLGVHTRTAAAALANP